MPLRRWSPALAVLAVALGLAGCAPDATADDPADRADAAAAGASTTVAPVESDGAAVPSPGCEPDASVEAGLTSQQMTSGDTTREYRRFVPSRYTGDRPTPLVVDLHGLTMNAELEALVTGVEDLADTEGFVAVTPDGLGDIPHWNYISYGSAADDVTFIDQLVAQVGDDLCVDTSRVYATGISNGGLMSSALACRLPEVFAAVAPVAGLAALEDCDDGPPVPIQVVYGTADNVLPYAGGLGSPLQAFLGSNSLDASAVDPAEQREQLETVAFPPVEDSMAVWAARNGCSADPTEERVSDEVTLRSWPGCDGGAEVNLYVVDDGGHSWPGTDLGGSGAAEADPAVGGLASVAGHTTQDISATDLAWAFFQRHQLQTQP